MTRRVVVTGIGMLAPNGIGRGAVWSSVLERRSALGAITRFDAADFPACAAGELRGFDPLQFMPPRLSRKLDPYTHYAVAACQLTLTDAEIDLEKVDRLRFGVYVGNCFGGWQVTDRELRKLHTVGVREVSPFQATSWFPAAPQGQVSILFGLRGHSKTLACDRASGLVSVGLAARSITQGYCDLVLAGGTEAPITPFAYLACMTDGIVAEGHDGETSVPYRPFDAGHRGLVPGEGATFLLLEEREHALRRNARIYAEICGFAATTDACHPAPLPARERGLSLAMSKALDDADVTPGAVSVIMADGMATREGDRQETTAIHKVFGERGRTVPVTVPKSMTGHLYGAAGAMDAALAALAIHHRTIPPMVDVTEHDAGCDLSLATEAKAVASLDCVLVNGRGSGGVNATLVVCR